ncbi:MAG: DUF4870 domain-containing protein [Planctomycetota bacterium]|nr:DUF4870 domain-containing protein [Planctomycetota bacterium]
MKSRVNEASTGRVVDPDVSADESRYAVFTHLAGLLSLVTANVPIASLIGTLVMWQIKKSESPFLDDHGRESVNFQISLLVYLAAGGAVLGLLTMVTFGIAAPLLGLGWVVLAVLNCVGCVRGAIAAGRREFYRYPMCLRFL